MKTKTTNTVITDFIKKYGNVSMIAGNFYNGDLDLQGTAITSLPDGLQVGGSLYQRGTGIKSIPDGIENQQVTPVIPMWYDKDGNLIAICADGILTEVVSKRGNVMRVRRISRKEIGYLITDGSGNYAHGDTLDEAKEDLIFKITDRKTSDYEHLTLTDTLDHMEAMLCYRVITGACRQGIKHFIETKLGHNAKPSYTIAEIIDITKGEYRSDVFREFFEK